MPGLFIMMCLNPMVLHVKGQDDMLVPCGQCRYCRIMRSNLWAMRMMHEKEYWKTAVYLTLTYNNENLPIDGQLSKRDAALFLKRVRKEIFPNKIKYFMCGEYGDEKGRPHYHFIIFGMSPADKDVFDSCWMKGFTYVELVTMAACKYVTKYITKAPLGRSRKDAMEQNKVPAFQTCSKGLGLRWIMENAATVGARGLRRQGRQACMPRYYVKKMRDNALLCDSVVEDAKLEGMQKSNELHRWLKEHGMSFYEFNAQRAEDVKSKDSLYSGMDINHQ